LAILVGLALVVVAFRVSVLDVRRKRPREARRSRDDLAVLAMILGVGRVAQGVHALWRLRSEPHDS